MAQEQRTARLTVLIDPDKKSVFEALCARNDVTPSQVVRRLIRDFIEEQTGVAWKPGKTPEDYLEETGASKGSTNQLGKSGPSQGLQRERSK